MPNPTLGVMTLYLHNRHIEELDFFRKLTLAGSKLGLDVFVFTPEDVEEVSKTMWAHIYDVKAENWVRKRKGFPDIVYDRCRFQRTYRFQLLRKFRKDHPTLLIMSRPLPHKWGMHQNLNKNRKIRPYLPETLPYRSSSELSRFLERHSLVYLKPTDGTGGRGILRIEETGNGRCLIQGRDLTRKIIAPQAVQKIRLGEHLKGWKLNSRYLVQQGIRISLKDGRVHDYRLLIQKNGGGDWEVTGCAGRVGPKRSITSNLHGGGMAISADKLLSSRFSSEDKPKEIREAMDRLAHEVVLHVEKHFGSMCEMALDIAVDAAGRIWLLEINPKPAREVFDRIGEKSVYDKAILRPLEYALYLIKNKK